MEILLSPCSNEIFIAGHPDECILDNKERSLAMHIQGLYRHFPSESAINHPRAVHSNLAMTTP